MIEIQFNELTFEGIKLKREEEYPWKNKEERRTFYSNLTKGGIDWNRDKFIRFSKKELSEDIHIFLSKSYIYSMSSYLVLFLFIISLFGTSIFSICGTAIVFFIFRMISSYFKDKAKINYTSLHILPELTNAVFNIIKEGEKEVQKY